MLPSAGQLLIVVKTPGEAQTGEPIAEFSVPFSVALPASFLSFLLGFPHFLSSFLSFLLGFPYFLSSFLSFLVGICIAWG